MSLNSAIYEGQVRHRRFAPKYHDFTYKVFMVYLDLQELDTVFSKTRLWSMSSFALCRFQQKDYFEGRSDASLYDMVADKVEQELDFRPTGNICMLANLRYYGFVMNPIVCYYCFNDAGDKLEAVVAEVTNTPWKERHIYVLDMRNESASSPVLFDKEMHVSPFQPMDMVYRWKGQTPNKKLLMHFDMFSKGTLNEQGDMATDKGSIVFDATLAMQRRAMTASNMRKVIISYPWMTMKVLLAIYWQALKLWLKGIAFIGHPESTVTIKKEAVAPSSVSHSACGNEGLSKIQ